MRQILVKIPDRATKLALHLKGRGFQGFKKIIAEERLPQAIGEPTPAPEALSINNRRTTTTFNQEFPFTNRVKEVAVDLVTGGTLSRTTTWWYAQLTGADKRFGPWVLYPTATKEERFDLPTAGGGTLSTTTTVTSMSSA